MISPLNSFFQRKCRITPQNQSQLGEIAKSLTGSYKNSKAIRILGEGQQRVVLAYSDTYVKKPELRIGIISRNKEISGLNQNIDGDNLYDEEIFLSHDYVSLGGKDKFSFKHKRIGKENENGNSILENLLPMILKKLNIGEH